MLTSRILNFMQRWVLKASSTQIEHLRSEVLAELKAQRASLAALERRHDGLQARVYDRPSLRGDFYSAGRKETMEEYWTGYNVTSHIKFDSAAASLAYLEYRNKLYPGYIDLLPVAGWDGKVILDYGCGPGNDLVGFAHYSRPQRLIGADVSKTSLREAGERLRLHDAEAELVHVQYGSYDLPLPAESVDYIHCSGVLMLIEEPPRLLKEFRRILKPDGELRLMVYNYDSIWIHLYVAYVIQIENALYSDVEIKDAFSRTTDGEGCPFVHVWRPSEMANLAAAARFGSAFIGAAMSIWELHLFSKRFRAIQDPRLRAESRDFLLDLEIDPRGFPLYRGKHAGIDACYRLRPTT